MAAVGYVVFIFSGDYMPPQESVNQRVDYHANAFLLRSIGALAIVAPIWERIHLDCAIGKGGA
ncbi:MAG: hypothetical protein JW892_10960 [Anaerolineae bacterium]|nr:hypothetical protein [Anaerolineae bacterium]